MTLALPLVPATPTGHIDEEFTLFYKHHYPNVLRVAQKRTIGTINAADIASEVFCIAWRRHTQGEKLSAPWLFTVLRNVLGNENQRIIRSQALIEKLETTLVQIEESEPTNNRIYTRISIRRAVASLNKNQREILYLSYWEDRSSEEIGQLLHLAPNTVRVRLSRARNALKALLLTE